MFTSAPSARRASTTGRWPSRAASIRGFSPLALSASLSTPARKIRHLLGVPTLPGRVENSVRHLFALFAILSPPAYRPLADECGCLGPLQNEEVCKRQQRKYVSKKKDALLRSIDASTCFHALHNYRYQLPRYCSSCVKLPELVIAYRQK